MKKIAVTGAAGGSGRVIVEHLTKQGFETVSIDIKAADPALPGVFHIVDAADYDEIASVLKGCDAVVHFGANPWPEESFAEGADRFRNNTLSTFNVFQAAAEYKIKRVVWASSETVVGFPFETCTPDQVPITEDHRPIPQCAYALSKLACEVLAEQMSSLYGTVFVGLRLANILYDRPGFHAGYHHLPDYWKNIEVRKNTLWKYIDVNDVAELVECSLTAQLKGAHIFNACALDTLMLTPTRDLFAQFFPDVPVSNDLPEFGSPMSVQKAKDLLGWTPRRSWRDFIQP